MTSLPPSSTSPNQEPQLPRQREDYGAHGAYGSYHAAPYSGGGYYGPQSGMADGGQPPTRSVQDYFVMIRERVWYLVLTVLVCGISAAIFTFNQTPEYMAAAKLRVTRTTYDLASVPGNMPAIDQVMNSEDFMTQVALMNSLSVIEKVDKNLPQATRKEVLEPYQDGNFFTGPLRPIDVLMSCYDVKPMRGSLLVNITYTHPNPGIAQKLAQQFAEAIVDNNKEARAKIANPAIEQMGLQLTGKDSSIKELYKERTKMMEDYPGLMSFGSKLSTANAELTSATTTRDSDEKIFQDAKALWDRLQDLKKGGFPTTDLPAVASNERVMSMQSEVSKQEIAVDGLKKLYQGEHPRLVPAVSQLEKAKSELAKAVVSAEAKIEQNYMSAKANYDSSKARWEQTSARMLALSESSDKLELLNKRIEAEEKLRASLQMNYEAEKLKASNNATIIQLEDQAMLTNAARPINKKWFLYCGGGIFGGIALGCALIFLLAFLDDRVKSSADIENFLGLSLIGVLPVAARMNSFRKARVVATGEDRAVVEGFRAIYSALKINDAARTAKAFLTTSTTPSEGKSFVTTNLAMTFAMHGEKVLIIDADLRMPAVGKSLQLEGSKGITRYFQGGVSLDDSIYHEVAPNLDVLTVGDPCKNPTQVLNSRRFADMIDELKGKYDRIFLDSPPVGAVSDSLNLLPQVDGVIYIVRFNTVKRRFIKSNIRRLQESKVPVFGAVLNQIGLRVARYYTNTGDRAYAKYYSAAGKDAVDVNV